MAYLLGEIVLYLAIAAALGLGLGWLVWGWRREDRPDWTEPDADPAPDGRADYDALRRDLEACAESHGELEGRLAAAEAERDRTVRSLATLTEENHALRDRLEAAESGAESPEGLETALAECTAARDALAAENAELRAALGRAGAEPAEPTGPAAPPGPVAEEVLRFEEAAVPPAPQSEPEAPAGLFGERPAEVDNLQRIKGIGPKMERILNENGIYRFRQLAGFGEADLAWLDAAIGAFPGRVRRDGWVAQARALARREEQVADEPE